MAIRLPEYERQVRAAPVQAPRVQVNAPSSQGLDALGRGLQQFSAGVGHAVVAQARETARADALRVDVAAQQLAETKRQLLEDPASGFLTTRSGQAAITDSDSVKNTFGRYAESLAQKLSPSQRAALEPIALHETSTLGHAVDLHVSKQSELLEQETSKALFTGKANEASSAAVRGDMDAVEDAIGAGLGHLDELASRNGWTPVIRAEKERAYTASARQGVIETLLGANQPGQASKLLHEWGASLDQDKLNDSKLRERVDGAVVKSQAETIAADAWGLSKRNAADAEFALSKDVTLDPRVRDLAIGLVRKRSDDFNETQKKADSDVLSRIGDKVARYGAKFTMADLDTDHDFLELRTQPAKTKAAEMIRAEARRRSGSGSERRMQAEIDALAMSDYRAEEANDADLAMEIDIDDRYATASQKTRNLIRERKGKLGTAEGKKEAISRTEFSQWMNDHIGPDVSKDLAGKMRDNMLKEYERYKSDHGGKEMPRSEAKKFLEDQFTDVDSGHWWKRNRSRAESEARGWIKPNGGAAAAPAQAATPSATQQAAAARDANGKPYTPEQQAAIVKSLNKKGIK